MSKDQPCSDSQMDTRDWIFVEQLSAVSMPPRYAENFLLNDHSNRIIQGKGKRVVSLIVVIIEDTAFNLFRKTNRHAQQVFAEYTHHHLSSQNISLRSPVLRSIQIFGRSPAMLREATSIFMPE